jgi:hypothetical protein
MAVDLTQDYLYVDGMEAVLLIVKGAGEETEGNIPNAKRFEVTKELRQYTSGIQLHGGEILWAISQNETLAIGVTDIQTRDKLQDSSGTVFSVVNAKYVQMTGMWWLTTREQPKQGT